MAAYTIHRDLGETATTKVQALVKRDPRETRQSFYDRHLPELVKQRHNLSLLLNYSNVTPFKDRNALGHMCAYCSNTYSDPEELRSHTRSAHEKERLSYGSGKCLDKFLHCLDIFDLKCTVCDNSVADLKSLVDHLTREHGKTYYTEISDYILPFKLSSEQNVQCSLCTEKFDSMRNLMGHMNVHFRNFMCLICGKGFVNKHRLKGHEAAHEKKTSYPCKLCDQVFEYGSQRTAHVITIHKGLKGDNVCQICKARFKNYYQKSRHMIEEHNRNALLCQLCDKKFAIKSSLLRHVRRDHVQERSFACEVCKKRFYSKAEMSEHLRIHTGEKEFSCDCGKSFVRKRNMHLHKKSCKV